MDESGEAMKQKKLVLDKNYHNVQILLKNFRKFSEMVQRKGNKIQKKFKNETGKELTEYLDSPSSQRTEFARSSLNSDIEELRKLTSLLAIVTNAAEEMLNSGVKSWQDEYKVLWFTYLDKNYHSLPERLDLISEEFGYSVDKHYYYRILHEAEKEIENRIFMFFTRDMIELMYRIVEEE